MGAVILQARTLLPDSKRLIDGGGIRTVGGRIAEVLEGAGAVRRARQRHSGRFVDLGGGLLAPGFVNAHAHLELSGLAGRLPAGSSFVDWIRLILTERRALDSRALARAVGVGARCLLAGGTTTVGDIASDPGSARAPRAGLRAVVYREVLDAWKPERTASALRRVRRPLALLSTRYEGISPHAPYTTSDALLSDVSRLARRRRLAVTMHWAETPGEGRWLRDGGGPLGSMLGPSPRVSGLDLLERAGLLRAEVSLAHGNHPGRGEPARLAAAGCVLVHCPGTHAFFGREPFPWRRYGRAGVPLALGTDSLASNSELDMRAEMSRARRTAPALSPARVFDMATLHGARALGLAGSVGILRRGALADFVLYAVEADGLRETLEHLTTGMASVRRVWVGGRRVHASGPHPS